MRTASRVLDACEYYESNHREVAHAIKESNPEAIGEAARLLRAMLPSGKVLLVPVPSHTGRATYTLTLAKAIGAPVFDVLRSQPREQLYTRKLRGEQPKPEELGLYLSAPIPEGWQVLFVDNVIGTGTTAKACRMAVGRGTLLAYAIDSTNYQG